MLKSAFIASNLSNINLGSKVKPAMAYKKFQSEQLFTGYELLNSDHVLITDEEGKIKDIVPAAEAGDEVQNFKGILSPGYNCHCHLELSHLKNVIPQARVLSNFLFGSYKEKF